MIFPRGACLARRRRALSLSRIDPERLYSLREAARLIPSSHGGHVCVKTLRRWRLLGLLRCRRLHVGWFVLGAEIERFLAGEPESEPRRRSRRAHARAQAEAAAELAGWKR